MLIIFILKSLDDFIILRSSFLGWDDLLGAIYIEQVLGSFDSLKPMGDHNDGQVFARFHFSILNILDSSLHLLLTLRIQSTCSLIQN